MGWIVRSWQGEERLSKVFWLYGMVYGALFQIILGAVHFVAVMLLGTIADIPYPALRISYFLWITVATWRCSFNVDWKIWGYIVRILMILNWVVFFAAIAVNLIK